MPTSPFLQVTAESPQPSCSGGTFRVNLDRMRWPGTPRPPTGRHHRGGAGQPSGPSEGGYAAKGYPLWATSWLRLDLAARPFGGLGPGWQHCLYSVQQGSSEQQRQAARQSRQPRWLAGRPGWQHAGRDQTPAVPRSPRPAPALTLPQLFPRPPPCATPQPRLNKTRSHGSPMSPSKVQKKLRHFYCRTSRIIANLSENGSAIFRGRERGKRSGDDLTRLISSNG